MPRLTFLAAALLPLLLLPLPAEARLGDSLAACKRFADQPGVHHVRVQLAHGKVVQESWWLDLELTEAWKLDRIRKLRGAIASPRKLLKEWRAGTGIDDNLLADYDGAVRAGVFFVGQGQAQTLSLPTGGLAGLRLLPDDGLLVTVAVIDHAAKAWAAANDARVVALRD